MKYKIKYIVSRLRYDSFLQIMLDALKLIRIHIHPFYVYLEGINYISPERQASELDGYEIGFAEREHMQQLLDFADRNYLLDKLYNQLENGGLCIAAWSDGKICAFSWVDMKMLTYHTYRFELRQHEAYLYDAYTAPEHRGRGLAHHIRTCLYRILADQGRNTLFSVTERFNPPALRYKSKLGAQIVGFVIIVDLFGLWRFGTTERPEKLRALEPNTGIEGDCEKTKER